MEALQRCIEFLCSILQFLLQFGVILPPFDSVADEALNVDCVILGEGGWRVDVGLRVMNGLSSILD